MKTKYISIIALLLFFISTVDTSAQVSEKKAKKWIVGEWKIDVEASYNFMSNNKEKKYKLPEKKEFIKRMENMKLTFTKDQNFKVQRTEEKIAEGSYDLKDQILITLVKEREQELNYKISKQRLELYDENQHVIFIKIK